MKLLDANGYSPDKYKKNNNKIFQLFENEINYAFSNPKSRDRASESIVNDQYLYNLSEYEKDYCENFYVDVDQNQHLIQPHSGNGKNSTEIIHFLQDKRENILLLIAPVGWGKTMLLDNVFRYLISKKDELKNVWPIFFTMDKYCNTLKSKNKDDIVSKLRGEIFPERLRRLLLEEYYTLDNENMWDYFRKTIDGFSDLAMKEKSLKTIWFDNPSEIKRETRKLRAKAQERDEFPFSILKYVRRYKDIIPVMILDNIDPLSIETNKILFDEALRLEEHFQLKIIISMRRSTFYELANRPDNTIRANPPKEFWLQNLKIENYLKHRINIATNLVENRAVQITPPNGPTFKFSEAKKVFSSMMKSLLSKDRMEVLDFIAYHNLRKVNRLVRTYAASGFLDEQKTTINILKGEIGNYEGVSPLWVLLSSLITNNHETYFFRKGIPCHEGNILNLYDAKTKLASRHFIRIHILNFLKKQSLNADISPNTGIVTLIKSYQSLYNKQDYELIETTIREQIQALLYCDLVTSPEYYGFLKKDNIMYLKKISITDTGEFFLEKFRRYYEYLVYMKDGTELGRNFYGIKDCITTKPFPGRYDNVYKFLKMIFENEKKFLRNLDKKQRQIFWEYFSFNGEVFVTALPTKKMISFGLSFKNKLSNDDENVLNKVSLSIKSLTELQEEIIDVTERLFLK